MTKAELAIEQMESWAKDDSHGYSQILRWGQLGDFDCSSAIIQAWENAGVPIKSAGATYTGDMYTVMTHNGFKDVTDQVNLENAAGAKRADVFFNKRKHTAMYCGNGLEVCASQSETGGIDGQPGDQTGEEFLIRPYRNYYDGGWDCVLRYEEEDEQVPIFTFSTDQICYGDQNIDVFRLKIILRARGFYDGPATSYFNKRFETAVMRWQEAAGLDVDGVFGNRQSWPTLLGLERNLYGRWILTECEVGMMGSKCVLLLQEMLKGLPYNYYKGALDWDFGEETKAALMAFQLEANRRGANLNTEGRFDIDTMAYMIGTK